MAFSYVALLVAFYVDNGRDLPLWRSLPPFMCWLMPIAFGIPLVVRALLRHQLTRRAPNSAAMIEYFPYLPTNAMAGAHSQRLVGLPHPAHTNRGLR
jgi:hypothetical protein